MWPVVFNISAFALFWLLQTILFSLSSSVSPGACTTMMDVRATKKADFFWNLQSRTADTVSESGSDDPTHVSPSCHLRSSAAHLEWQSKAVKYFPATEDFSSS